MINAILRYLSFVNRNRIKWRRQRKIKAELRGVETKSLKCNPKEVKKVLIIDALYCFGDALFVNGLLRCLKEHGVIVGIVTFARLKDIYGSVVESDLIFDIEDQSSYKLIFDQNWDMAVDLCYMFNDRWKYRKNIIMSLMSYTVVCDMTFYDIPKTIYSEVLDISACKHFGDRMARVAERIIGSKVGTVLPYAPSVEADVNIKQRYVYVNTVGGTPFRCLSKEQIQQIANELNGRRIKGLFYCSEDFDLSEGQYIQRIRPDKFTDCLHLIYKAEAVISPDTSVVHVASAYDKPLLALYCANDPEHYGQQMKDVWAPCCAQQVILIPKNDGAHRVSVSQISEECLRDGLVKLFNFIGF